MLDKITSLFKNRKFISFLLCLPFICVVIFVTWPLPAIILIDPIISLISFVGLFGRTLVIYLILFSVIALFMIFVWPIAKYSFLKARTYSSLRHICRKNKYKFKIVRSPFASLKGLAVVEDIKITTPRETFCIHYVDIIRPSKYLIDVNSTQYTVMYKKTKQIKLVKDFDFSVFSSSKDTNVFFIQSPNLVVRLIKGNNRETLENNAKFNSMVFYYSGGFIRMLNR